MPLTGYKVLVLEDDYLIADDLSDLLADAGADVVGPISNVRDALAQVRDDGFDMALVDVGLGNEKAYPVADLLRELNVPFVFVTGYGEESLPERFRGAALCKKPFNESCILDAVKSAIQEPPCA